MFKIIDNTSHDLNYLENPYSKINPLAHFNNAIDINCKERATEGCFAFRVFNPSFTPSLYDAK